MSTLPPLDLIGLNQLVFARLASNTEGLPVRAVATVHRSLQLYTGAPPFPFGLLLRGAVAQRDAISRAIPYTWIWYDDAAAGYNRITALLPLVAAAYNVRALYLPQGGAINAVEVDDGGAEGFDRQIARAITIQQLLTIYL